MKESQQKRHIELAVVRVEEHTVTFRISQQTHREEAEAAGERVRKALKGDD